ncbi:MAG: acyl-CoA dehydrogenase family protein [Burkholderiaceae bacterium]
MKLRLTEEQSLIEASVRTMLQEQYSFAQRQRSLDAPQGCRAELWAQFAELGWLALPVPQHAGGLGGGALETGLLMRAFGRHLVVEPYLPCAVLTGRVLAALGSRAQAAAWLPGLVEGRVRAALAHDEAGQHDPWVPATKTIATRRGKQWELAGTKLLARGAPGADVLIVTAMEAASGDIEQSQRVFLLRPGAAGLVMRLARCSDGAHAADLQLNGVLVDDGDLLAAGAAAALRDALAGAVVALCWEAVGAMAAALEMTADHARQRMQFGRPLIQFQVVEHRLAEMAVCCEEAQAACELAALGLDRGDSDAGALASMAKAKVGRAARYVAQQAVQLHGAMGVTEELAIASYFRRLMAFTQQYGSTDWHAHAFAEAELANGAWRHSRTLPLPREIVEGAS